MTTAIASNPARRTPVRRQETTFYYLCSVLLFGGAKETRRYSTTSPMIASKKASNRADVDKVLTVHLDPDQSIHATI